MTKINKQRIVDQINMHVAAHRETINLHKSCLWYAYATVEILCLYNIRGVLQAGDASFQIVPDEEDDGVSPTHYSYVSGSENWSESQLRKLAMLSIVEQRLPEIHVWAAIPETNEIIDLTTKYVPRLSKEAGLPCKTAMPDYVWEDAQRLANTGFLYHPSQQATMLAMFLSEQDPTIADLSVVSTRPRKEA